MIAENFQPWFVIFVVFLIFLLIYKEYLKASVSFLLAVLLFSITGILTPSEVLSGFSNESIASILMLILITTGLRKNFKIESLFDAIFRKAKTYRGFLFRMMSQVAIISSLINNTPVVALMTPYVVDWGKRNNIAPSKLLIPLSYATIMGGMITLIGTSTTLVLNGFLQDFEHPSLLFEDLFTIGTSVTIFGILFIILIGYRLLPDHKDVLKAYSENRREYVVETKVLANSKLIGLSVIEAGLRNLKGVYLVEIMRGSRLISPVSPNEVLAQDDILFFAGNTKDIVDLINSDLGIELPTTARSYDSDKAEVIEAVMNNFSSLVGMTVKQSNFRNRYNAAIVAIHRNGEKVSGRIGDIVLQAGDLLLLYTGSDFRDRVEIYRDLFVVSKLRVINKPGNKKYYALILMAICALVLLIFSKMTLFPALMIILGIMIGFNLITTQDVKRELDLNMIAILVFSLAIGQAIIKTKAGDMVALAIINLLEPYGNFAILVGLLVITNLLASIIGNVGAISISFPLAYSISSNLGIEGYPFFLTIAYAASAAFLTPISYQTNLIIFGPGGYKFKDFFRIGLPVNIIYLAIALFVIIYRYREILF
ncbi:MAG: anion permease [Cytophagales bacterium]|nr:anion permease [Cytophagales bacterium]